MAGNLSLWIMRMISFLSGMTLGSKFLHIDTASCLPTLVLDFTLVWPHHLASQNTEASRTHLPKKFFLCRGSGDIHSELAAHGSQHLCWKCVA